MLYVFTPDGDQLCPIFWWLYVFTPDGDQLCGFGVVVEPSRSLAEVLPIKGCSSSWQQGFDSDCFDVIRWCLTCLSMFLSCVTPRVFFLFACVILRRRFSHFSSCSCQDFSTSCHSAPEDSGTVGTLRSTGLPRGLVNRSVSQLLGALKNRSL